MNNCDQNFIIFFEKFTTCQEQIRETANYFSNFFKSSESWTDKLSFSNKVSLISEAQTGQPGYSINFIAYIPLKDDYIQIHLGLVVSAAKWDLYTFIEHVSRNLAVSDYNIEDEFWERIFYDLVSIENLNACLAEIAEEFSKSSNHIIWREHIEKVRRTL